MLIVCNQLMALTPEEEELADLGVEPTPVKGKVCFNAMDLVQAQEEIGDDDVPTGNTTVFIKDSPSMLIDLSFDELIAEVERVVKKSLG